MLSIYVLYNCILAAFVLTQSKAVLSDSVALHTVFTTFFNFVPNCCCKLIWTLPIPAVTGFLNDDVYGIIKDNPVGLSTLAITLSLILSLTSTAKYK